ncbi:nuclear transport factor 2 family protein [Streptococcus zalophi]|uniref:DUF4440 domain-containing protein n=1 Tax=Streptococcus zalophi TaxID=640031 RepID=A0A934PBR9_9STRE|nr:hypothetical protein [Streptococcus zalophi]MBJ8350286.1 hypothetical protein [Streptococcus zalophi]
MTKIPDILAYERRHLTNDKRKDQTYLDVLHPDYKEFGASGRIFYKNDFEKIDLLESDYQIIDYNVLALSETSCLATYQLIDNMTGQKTNRSSIWVIYQNDWKLLFHQGTVVNEG